MAFHWRLSDSKSPPVSRTLLSILAVINNAVVWLVSARPPASKSSSHFDSPLVTVPNVPITIGIIVIFMFHSFFNSLARWSYLSFFSLFFSFILCPNPIGVIIIYSFRVFHISFSWWFFTGVWVTASLLRSPGLVSGFWPFSAMLSFG